MVVLFKYCTDVKNCESFRGFSNENYEFEFKLNLLER